MRYVSPRAKALGPSIVGEAVVLGPSVVGEGCLIEDFVVLGHPTRAKVARLLSSPSSLKSPSLIPALDEVSEGVKLGRGVIVRSSTVIYEGVELEDGVETGHFVLVREGCKVSSGARVGSGAILDGHVRVGAGANIQSRAFLPPRTVIGERVFIGPGVIVTNDRYPPSGRLVETVIEDEAVIGAGAVLVAGVRVGRRAVVAAGAVVIRDVRDGEVVAGCPARRLMGVEEYERRREAYVRAGGCGLDI